MNKPPKVEIDFIGTHGGSDFYNLHNEFGAIDAVYSPDRTYQVANFDVFVRRQGHGRNLLRQSREHAIQLGAKCIIAALVSREAYETARRVFGDESLRVIELGSFAPEENADSEDEVLPTSVLLKHRLSNE